ncbi:MAG: EFR1 family ferrodoxin [Promethearchaeota archaeon]
MKNCLLVYYTLGGTTERIADKISIGLEAVGYKVDKFNLKDGSVTSIENYDLLGIGTPSYYFREPFIITDYLKSLPKLDIPYFTFILYASIIGDAGNRIRKRLNKKGGRDVGFFKCNGKNNFYAYIKRGAITYPSHPNAEDFEQAENFGKNIKSNIENDSYQPEDFDKKPGFIYRFERFTTQQWMVQKMYYRFFKVNKSKCTKCGICVKSCPTNAISMENEEIPKFGKECIGCFNCVLKCPEDAISSVIDWWIFRPFLAYNVRNLPKIPSIELAKVKLSRGKVERLE